MSSEPTPEEIAKKYGATLGKPIDNSEWAKGVKAGEKLLRKKRAFENANSHMIADDEL